MVWREEEVNVPYVREGLWSALFSGLLFWTGFYFFSVRVSPLTT